MGGAVDEVGRVPGDAGLGGGGGAAEKGLANVARHVIRCSLNHGQRVLNALGDVADNVCQAVPRKEEGSARLGAGGEAGSTASAATAGMAMTVGTVPWSASCALSSSASATLL